jgi:puromycin-sensitive aminopeptidase
VENNGYRLPRRAKPRRYELELRPDLGSATFSGAETVLVDVLDETDRLVLNAVDLDVPHVELATPGGEVLRPEVRLDAAEQQLSLLFGEPLAPGDGYRLSLEFSGRLNDLLRGFYRSTYRDESGAERVIATTQFESTDARRAFPCWDEPDFKAMFQVTIVCDPDLAAFSNAPVESRRTRDDGRVEVRFAETMPMSTYLVAFVVGPFEATEPVVAAGVPVRVVATPDKLHLASFALEVAAHAVEFLSGYFGIPYPGAKLDHVAVPDFSFGAMENLGCVVYRENLLLVDPASAAQTELQRIATVVAHETAHMWFGDLVTMRWWNGIWLNEAFATFMELTTADAYRPEWQVWTAFGAGKSAAMVTDGLRSTRPVEYPVGRPEEAEAMFDVLTYQKGGSVLRMMEQYLGADTFRKGISQYLTTHAYGNTETSDLWDALESVSGEPVGSIMASWINQGGYPVVSVERGDSPAKLVLRQRRFVYDGRESPERWTVPLDLRASLAGEVHRERVLLGEPVASVTFPGPVDWVVVNGGAWGFYRTRYSPELWRALRDAGPAAALSPLERFALVSDAWAAVVSGDGDLGDWVDVVTTVAVDADPDVWGAVLGTLGLLDLLAGAGSGDADRAALEAFARRLAAPVWQRLGWDPPAGEDERTAVARGRVLLALGEIAGDQAIVAEATRRVRLHLADDQAGVLAPDVVGPAAQIAVAAGDAALWEELLDAYRRSDKPQDKLRYLYSLAHTPDPGLRLRTLELSVGEEVRAQDAPFLVASVLSRRGQAEAWRWLESRWEDLSSRLPTNLVLRVVEAVTAFVDGELAAAVHRFCETHELGVTELRLAQILERMDLNVAVASRLRGTLAGALG